MKLEEINLEYIMCIIKEEAEESRLSLCMCVVRERHAGQGEGYSVGPNERN